MAPTRQLLKLRAGGARNGRMYAQPEKHDPLTLLDARCPICRKGPPDARWPNDAEKAKEASALFAVFQLVIVFTLVFAAGVWVIAQVLPDRQGPPGWFVIAVLVSVSLFTAYVVVR